MWKLSTGDSLPPVPRSCFGTFIRRFQPDAVLVNTVQAGPHPKFLNREQHKTDPDRATASFAIHQRRQPERPYMTTKPTKPETLVQLPDPPEQEPEDMTSFDHLTLSGSVHHLAQHLGQPPRPPSSPARGTSRRSPAPLQRNGWPRPDNAFNARPGGIQGQQRVHHLHTGEAPRLGHGDSLTEYRTRGCHPEERGLRQPGNPRILAVRRDRRVPRNQIGRRPADGRQV